MNTQHAQIQRLQARSNAQWLELISLLFFIIFVNLFLPSVLVQYYYQPQDLLAQPALLEMLPVVGFALGTAYALVALISSIARTGRIRSLEAELKLSGDNGCCGHCSDPMDAAELEELEALVEQALAETAAPAKKKATKKAAPKKTAAKTTRKRTTKSKK